MTYGNRYLFDERRRSRYDGIDCSMSPGGLNNAQLQGPCREGFYHDWNQTRLPALPGDLEVQEDAARRQARHLRAMQAAILFRNRDARVRDRRCPRRLRLVAPGNAGGHAALAD